MEEATAAPAAVVVQRPRAARPGHGWPRLAVHVLCLLPLIQTYVDAGRAASSFDINPVQAITQRTGFTALTILAASLAVTPLGSLFGWRQLIPHRRTLGLYAFGWALAHATITIWDFSWLDGAFDAPSLKDNVVDKPYALVGLTCICLLTPLALTSTQGWMKRLGRRWKRLHQLIYLIAPLVVLHYLWSVKADWRPPAAFGVVVAVLLALRLPVVKRRLGERRKAAAARA